ncbi:1-acyl-sn-glycerol-3-phosphate acyltransferase [Mycoplasma sp. U97]|nr:lysophospholipid acyltransferase family protein [Mycoplasma tauri]MBZ4204194.1 1-acyl-sn-glycerol-3-phosphate acyltransferase [Mycoplasma tauri]MBZ4212745.1 1-acyl-sn-glycerol-3-phosphate acyltransferase [Mycoplasma tauri]MBZ4217987.1 1-acyl-sn-glycerol-3-phosphate acyltransferase [Mycoplasma tauri]MBZ4226555.1 1-acyl-sn-glycerol-3-phosphate acyltransferase [Mycoplasma tauri]QSB07481.1 1-acyl-sn-glycerol-3-phosphate acyltransferase [Mycoplasma tauri]
MFIIKMFFFWWYFLWHLWRINVFAKKYRKDPEGYYPQYRNSWLINKVKLFLWFYSIKVKVEGYENIPKGPVLLTPNHKSYLDPIVLIYALKKQSKEETERNRIGTFLAKIELSKKKIMRNLLSLIDTFYINRENIRQSVKVLNEFGLFVKQNSTCGVIFPEGHRIEDEGLGEFKNGAFKVAVSNYLPIVPVVIWDTRKALSACRMKKRVITVKFLPAMKPNNFLTMDSHVIANRVKTNIEGALKNE